MELQAILHKFLKHVPNPHFFSFCMHILYSETSSAGSESVSYSKTLFEVFFCYLCSPLQLWSILQRCVNRNANGREPQRATTVLATLVREVFCSWYQLFCWHMKTHTHTKVQSEVRPCGWGQQNKWKQAPIVDILSVISARVFYGSFFSMLSLACWFVSVCFKRFLEHFLPSAQWICVWDTVP